MGIGVVLHGPELNDPEGFAVLADAMTIKEWMSLGDYRIDGYDPPPKKDKAYDDAYDGPKNANDPFKRQIGFLGFC